MHWYAICNPGLRLFESRMKCIKKAELSRIHEFEIHNYYAEFLQFSEGQIAALHATNQLVKQHTKKTIKCLWNFVFNNCNNKFEIHRFIWFVS